MWQVIIIDYIVDVIAPCLVGILPRVVVVQEPVADKHSIGLRSRQLFHIPLADCWQFQNFDGFLWYNVTWPCSSAWPVLQQA